MTDPCDRWRALDDPFGLDEDWQPIPGTCSRCGQPAALGTRRWWHLDAPCPARGRTATFIPHDAGHPGATP